jgi:hypothetical protein
MALEEVEWEAWTGLIWFKVGGRWRELINVVMNFRVP